MLNLGDPLTERIMRSQMEAPPRRCRIGIWNVFSGLVELAALAVTILAIPAGCILLGLLLAWVISGGPEGVKMPVRVLSTRGVGLGVVILIAGALGYIWGATCRRSWRRPFRR